MKPTWRARHCVSLPLDMCVISSPATVMLPWEGTSSPPSKLSSVVLPEPLGPMKATNSPASTSRFNPRNTSISSPPRLYFLSSPRILIRLFPLPLPSTRTMFALLFLYFDSLPVLQICRPLHHHHIAGAKTRQYFQFRTARSAGRNRPSLHVPIL